MKKLKVEFKIENKMTEIYIAGNKISEDIIQNAHNAVEVSKKEDVEYPRKYQDYKVCVHEEAIPDSVEVKRMI